MQSILRSVGDYIVRHCEEKDLPFVININMAALPEHYSDYFFSTLLAELPEAFLVAEFKNQVIGYIMCKVEFGFSNFRKLGFVKKGHVVSIAVLEEHQGKGVGSALMLEGMNGVAVRKSDEIYLEVRVSNVSAVQLYKKLGFIIKSQLNSYYRDGEAAYLMARDLS